MIDKYIGMPWEVDTSYLHDEELKVAQEKNRKFAVSEQRKEWIKRMKEARNKVSTLRRKAKIGCDFCRGLPTSGYNLKFDCDRLYGLTIDHKADTASCPECKRILAGWE